MRHRAPLLGAALLALACQDAHAPAPQQARLPILGGVPSQPDEFPTVVSVVNVGLCSGTLIAPDIVLTAAHCISGKLFDLSQEAVTSLTVVRVGSLDAFAGGERITAAETIPHPQFDPDAFGDNDVGIIRLSRAVTDRAPSPIDRDPARDLQGSLVTQVGYGVNNVLTQDAGTLFVLDAQEVVPCEEVFAPLDDTLLCYDQRAGSGKCGGDSGGPSFDGAGVVVGLTSFGDPNCTEFGADTRVSRELDFIDAALNDALLVCEPDGVCVDGCGDGIFPGDNDCVNEINAGCASVPGAASPWGLLLLFGLPLAWRARQSPNKRVADA